MQRQRCDKQSFLHTDSSSLRIDSAPLRIDSACLRIDSACLRIDSACLRIDSASYITNTLVVRPILVWSRLKQQSSVSRVNLVVNLVALAGAR